MRRPPAYALQLYLNAEILRQAPPWFLPFILTLLGGAWLALDLIQLRHDHIPAAARQQAVPVVLGAP